MNEPDDVSTMTRLREGDADAWDSLYRRYRERVWRYVASATGAGEETVADLVQETFLEAARSARSFDATKGTVGGWILSIASRRIADSWRKTYRNRRLHENFAQTLVGQFLDGHANSAGDPSAATLSEPERRLSAKERASAVREALACLPGDYADLLAGKYFDDASLDDLASARGESAVAISSRLARARDALRQALRRVLPDEFKNPMTDRSLADRPLIERDGRPPPAEPAATPVVSANERRKPD